MKTLNIKRFITLLVLGLITTILITMSWIFFKENAIILIDFRNVALPIVITILGVIALVIMCINLCKVIE